MLWRRRSSRLARSRSRPRARRPWRRRRARTERVDCIVLIAASRSRSERGAQNVCCCPPPPPSAPPYISLPPPPASTSVRLATPPFAAGRLARACAGRRWSAELVASGSDGVCATLASRAARCSRATSDASRCASAFWNSPVVRENVSRRLAAMPSRWSAGWRPSTCARANESMAPPSRCTSCLISSFSWSISTTGSLKSDVSFERRSSRRMRSPAACRSRPIALAAVARSERGGLRLRGGWPPHCASDMAKNSAVLSTRGTAEAILLL